MQGRENVLTTCEKDVTIWKTFCRGHNISWGFRQPGDSIVKARCGPNRKEHVEGIRRKEMCTVT